MTDFATPADIVAALANTSSVGARQLGIKNSFTTVSGLMSSSWLAAGMPAAGVAPTTWATCTQALAGCAVPSLVDAGTATNRLLYWNAWIGGSCGITLVDRLGHRGGLDGTSVAAQTVSASLVTASGNGRCNADGSDVSWFLEWYVQTGATAVTATISYTNQAGTSGKTASVAVAATMIAGRLLPIQPASGDTSIKSIETVTLSASTLTVGNFGVTAFKQLDQDYALSNTTVPPHDWASCGLPKIGTGACISFIFNMASASCQFNFQVVIGAK